MLLNTDNWLYIYSETYQPNEFVGNEVFSKNDHAYLSQPLVKVTSFLGLPNDRRLSEKLSLSDIFKNMIGWNPRNEKAKKFSFRDGLFAIPIFLFCLLRSLVKTLFNIAKLVTELLPSMGEESCRLAMLKTKPSPSLLGFIVNAIGYFLFSALHFLGRAITSPVKGFLNRHQNEDLSGVSLLLSALCWGILGGIVAGAAAIIPGLFAGAFFAVFVAVAAGIFIASSKVIRPPHISHLSDDSCLKKTDSTTNLLKTMPPTPEKKAAPSLPNNTQSVETIAANDANPGVHFTNDVHDDHCEDNNLRMSRY